MKNLKITKTMLETFDIERIELEPLLFQTGYLTVREKALTKGAPVYVLDIPNYEVRDAFSMLQSGVCFPWQGRDRAKG